MILAVSRTRVAILGSTGSVGTQALAILRDRRDRFDVVALTARRGEQIAAQAAEFSPTAV